MQLWTYESVLEAAEKGGRICEAADGNGERSVFRIKYLEGFKALGQKRDTMHGVWEMRVVREEIEVEEQNRVTPDEDVEMGNLVEQLLDAKIATAQDSVVDDLAESVLKL